MKKGRSGFGSLTKRQQKKALAMLDEGYSLTSVARKYGISNDNLKAAHDPEWRKLYYERRAAQAKALRDRRSVIPPAEREKQVTRSSVHHQALALIDEIPPDTRSITQSLMGDPIPGDRRRQEWRDRNQKGASSDGF